MEYTAENYSAGNYTAGNYTAGFPSFWEGEVAESRGGRCAYLCIQHTCAYTYHLPLRGLLLPEGGEAMQDACET